MYKISVIVPIYNSEKTLERCIDSIVHQTINDIEIILIDDGSTDNSPKICDKYADSYKNIRVIHKQNEGLGKTYNLGISQARGKYIGFVESDDWINNDMYENMYNNAVLYNSDMVKCGLYYIVNNKDMYPNLEKYILNEITNSEQPFTILDNKPLLFYHSSVWATLYESSFIKNLKFSEESDASYQDFSFMIKALAKAKRISAVNKFLYHWNLDNDAASVKRKDKKLMRIVDQTETAKNFLIEENLFDALKSEFYKQTIISSYNFYNSIDIQYKQEFFNKLYEFFSDLEIKNLNEVIKYFEEYEIRFLLYILSGVYKD